MIPLIAYLDRDDHQSVQKADVVPDASLMLVLEDELRRGRRHLRSPLGLVQPPTRSACSPPYPPSHQPG